MSIGPRTSWRIRGLSYPHPEHRGLDVRLIVDTAAPVVVHAIEVSAARAGIKLERAGERDPRFAEQVGENEVAGLVVAFKALLVRAGGRVEITEAELLEARRLLARVDATPERMVVEVVEGAPPDTPRFAAEGH